MIVHVVDQLGLPVAGACGAFTAWSGGAYSITGRSTLLGNARVDDVRATGDVLLELWLDCGGPDQRPAEVRVRDTVIGGVVNRYELVVPLEAELHL